jgi:E3 ubiquitin-protein ligase HUWE1
MLVMMKLSVMFYFIFRRDLAQLKSQFAQEIFDPQKHPFFQPLDHDRNTFRLIKQASLSSVNLLRAIGRMIALSIHHKTPLGVKLPLSLWEQMLGKDSVLSSETVQADDPDLFKALRTLLDTDLSSPDGIHLTNGLTMNSHSASLDADIPVTEDNKLEYVGSVIQHRFQTSIEEEIRAFASGFTDIVPLDRFQDLLDPHDLNLMLLGESFIDVADLENHTTLVGYFNDSPQVIWFWELLYDSSVFTQKKLHELLRFATGDSSVPLGGFKNLRESFKLDRVPSMNPDQRLPTASTCFFTLDLPEYSNKDILRMKLIQAIELSWGFDLTL